MTHPQTALSHEQTLALEMCCDTTNRIIGVTGGAGTGKTVVLGHVYRELCQRYRTVLVAPTGRAAKRIQELTGIQSKTIHRLLEFPMPDDDEPADTNEPRRNAYNPLNEQIVIVDEASMLAPTLYIQLLDALPRNGSLRFFGDNNQLPPVEKGTPPFADILTNYPAIELTFNFRSGDAIVSNALRILNGSIPVRNERFEIIYSDDPIRNLIEFVKTDSHRTFADPTNQIIMPTRRGKFGTHRVNPSLQLHFNSTGPILRLDRFDDTESPLAVRAGDKFLWVQNDYGLEVFNGEIGVIEAVNPEDGSLELISPDRAFHVPARAKKYIPHLGMRVSYDPRKQIELGYAITTHKSQGSEFETVIYCITKGQAWLLNRRNFYTAVTRARERVIVICDRRGMMYSTKTYKSRD